MDIYSPLDPANKEIRLLSIHPGKNHDAPIVCDLEIVSLITNPEFEALSYTWGSPNNTKEILVNGHRLQVRENAQAAIRHLRLRKHHRYIWIDAICINQEDRGETAQQIRLMQNIYGQAEQVCIWLGEVSESGKLAIKHLRKIVPFWGWKQWKLDWKHANVFPRLRERAYSRYAGKTTETLMAEHLSGEIQELFDRPWWRRTWIIQEAVLAKKLVLMCGTEVVDWDTFGSLLRGDKAMPHILDLFGLTRDGDTIEVNNNYRPLSTLRYTWHENRESVRMFDLLYRFRAMDCANAEDKIFGFIGLLPSIASMVSIHEESVPISQTYIQFAHGTVREMESLDVLNYKREWRQTAWVPRPTYVYNLFDQAKYYDTHALMKPALDQRARLGWVRLPDGWERVYDGNRALFMNHTLNELSQTSPLEGTPPLLSDWQTRRHIPSKGWKKEWNNVGYSSVDYHGQGETKTEMEARLQREALEERLANELPSWVPNWASPREWDPEPLLDYLDTKPHRGGFNQAAPYRASGNTIPRSHSSADSAILSLQGHLVDEIEQLSESWHPRTKQPPTSRAPLTTLVAWEELACGRRQDCPYETTGGRMNALCRTMIADLPGDGAVPWYYTAFFEAWCDRVGWSKSAQETAGKVVSESVTDQQMKERIKHIRSLLPSEVLEYFQSLSPKHSDSLILSEADCPNRILKACAHRALFVTKKGYLGLAPWNAKAGDSVAILYGGKTPYLLRQQEGNPELWELVGETYVYGMMDDEFLQSLIQQGQTDQILNLS